jgi:peroxiredoxin Q/BCP
MYGLKTQFAAAFLLAATILSCATAATEAPADFTLPRIDAGKVFTLSENKGSFVALHFLLKTECPFCSRHTHTYLKRAGEVPGAVQVFIKPDSEEDVRKWARDMPKDAPIYRDADAALAGKFSIPDGFKFHGQTVHFPALILLGPDGKEVFRHVGKDNTDRYSFDDFARKIAELRGSAK